MSYGPRELRAVAQSELPTRASGPRGFQGQLGSLPAAAANPCVGDFAAMFAELRIAFPVRCSASTRTENASTTCGQLLGRTRHAPQWLARTTVKGGGAPLLVAFKGTSASRCDEFGTHYRRSGPPPQSKVSVDYPLRTSTAAVTPAHCVDSSFVVLVLVVMASGDVVVAGVVAVGVVVVGPAITTKIPMDFGATVRATLAVAVALSPESLTVIASVSEPV